MPNDINTQITRIMDNVAAAYTAALAKGATMPQNQNSDNLADTVASIAMPSFYAGSFTPAATGSNITVSHELGKTPSFCGYFWNNFISTPSRDSQVMAFGSTQNQCVYVYNSTSVALSRRSITADDGQYIRSANATSIVFTASSSSPKHCWVVGGSYIFVVW